MAGRCAVIGDTVKMGGPGVWLHSMLAGAEDILRQPAEVLLTFCQPAYENRDA